MITLSATDDEQVASATRMEVLLGEPAKRLLIFSGVAIPDFWTNHDEEVRTDEIVVKLGDHVAVLDEAVAHVGLASITNDETAFLFNLAQAVVELEEGSGELMLRVPAGILGEETRLNRFGYQVVVHVTRVTARISGTIRVPRGILDISGFGPNEVDALFDITANRTERTGGPGEFVNEKLVPVRSGVEGEVRDAEDAHFVDYVIDACPFNVPLVVDVRLTGRLDNPELAASQSAGERPVLLTSKSPEANGIDFDITRFKGPG
jgi:hypothetical protein